jgi:hypothetical protein
MKQGSQENVPSWEQIFLWNAPIKVVMAGGSKFFRIAAPNMKHTPSIPPSLYISQAFLFHPSLL